MIINYISVKVLLLYQDARIDQDLSNGIYIFSGNFKEILF